MSSPEILSPISISRARNTMSPDSNISLVNLSVSSPHNSDKFTSAQVQLMLKTKPNQYIIIENTGKHTSDCWTSFGFPAIVNDKSDPQRIDGFVSCKKCFTTYSFLSNSTRLLNQHNCEGSKVKNKKLEANGTSSTQRRLTAFYPAKQVNLKESEIVKIKNLQAQWVCQSIRPFSIIEDNGLRRLIQECISIGSRHGNINVDQVLRGADATAAHVSKLAEEHRVRISEELLEPLENDAITFCPDMWSDPIRQISYLGITITLVNDQFQFRSYDLCCSPFEEEDKTAESILAALQKELKRFGIVDLSVLKFKTILFFAEPIHFAATFLHLRYRYLRKCSNVQINSCKTYVRRQLKEIFEREKLKHLLLNQESERRIEKNNPAEPPLKKKKRFGEEYESGDLSDEYGETEDEVDKYLSMHIDPELIVDNPLVFWKANQKNLPLLSKLARIIHSIPATTASVEREFSSGGLVMSERRSSINPQNLNNILFLRSVTR
ncbi:unnamed protein product [Rotaria sordida]|uniref:Transposase n=1 Tax=Rotaria sordida TaxID=392033 RepID=A0A813TZX2_9BILA|nr:unnamed protein product [Rotaria sordida]